jgi:hypothetical protein
MSIPISGRDLRVACLTTAAVALAGCGTTTIDKGKAEAFVRSFFTPPARSASCPGGVEAKKGKTFTCTAVDSTGHRFRVVVHVVDDSGRVSVNSREVTPAG